MAATNHGYSFIVEILFNTKEVYSSIIDNLSIVDENCRGDPYYERSTHMNYEMVKIMNLDGGLRYASSKYLYCFLKTCTCELCKIVHELKDSKYDQFYVYYSNKMGDQNYEKEYGMLTHNDIIYSIQKQHQKLFELLLKDNRKLKKRINELETSIKYLPPIDGYTGSIGYKEARDDFVSRMYKNYKIIYVP